MWGKTALAAVLLDAASSILFLDDRSVLLQFEHAVHNEDDSAGTTSAFLDNNHLVCSEGPERTAEGALATKKASPLGSLFNASFAKVGKRCADLGFSLAGGEDKCFPGVTQYFASEEKVKDFLMVKAAALAKYQALYKLDEKIASVMVVCTCHPESPLRAGLEPHCENLSKNKVGSWVHRNPANGKPLVCDQGPFEYATRALATIKSSPLMPMHKGDQIAPITCAEQGFPLMYMATDHCYPNLHMWTKTEQPMHNCPPGGLGPHNPDCDDWGVVEAGDTERVLYKEGGFKGFSRANAISAVLSNNPACNCHPNSLVITITRRQKGADMCTHVDERSPVRDFWTG